VLCPSGQLRNKKGRCVYPNKFWYNQNYCIYINLTANTEINVTDFFNVSLGVKTTALPPLQSPWGQLWSVVDIFYKETDIKHTSNNFIIVIGTQLEKVVPNSLMQYIKKKVHESWSLNLNNKTIVLNSSNFASFTSFYHTVDSTNMNVFKNITEIPVKPKYNSIYHSLRFHWQNQHIITKMYVCEQIELKQSEYIFSQDKSILYSNITRRFLFDGEFTIVKSIIFDEFRVRICVEDSESQISYLRRNVGAILGNFCVSLVLVLEIIYFNFQF
jgi:hypothetical protein